MWGTLIVIVAAIAALVLLAWAFQRKLIYMPMGRVPAAASVLPGAQEVTVEPSGEPRLGGWFLPAATPPPRATVLVFNGNAGNRSFRAPLAHRLRERGFSVMLFDYRGYGGNPGSPSEEGLIADARAVHDYVTARPDVDPARLVYFGESLGTGVATALAAERAPLALVLRSPFTSLVDVGRIHYPVLPVRSLLIDRFDSVERLRQQSTPLLIIAGSRDRIVPASLSRQLFESAPMAEKRWLLIEGVGHNDMALLDGARMIGAVSAFVDEQLASLD